MVGLAITILRGSLPSPFPAAAPFFISKSRCSRSMPFFQRLAACSLPMPFFQRLLRLAVLETFFSKAELKVAFALFPKAALFPTSVLHACLPTLAAAFFPKASMHLYCKGCLAPFFSKGCCQCAFFSKTCCLQVLGQRANNMPCMRPSSWRLDMSLTFSTHEQTPNRPQKINIKINIEINIFPKKINIQNIEIINIF